MKAPRKIKGIDIESGTSIYSAKKINLDKLLHSEVIPEVANPKAIRAMPKAIDYAPSLTVSQLPFPRIAALWNIDQIKDRNKPIEPVTTENKIPFFLPDSFNIVPMPEQGETKVLEKPKSDMGIILTDKTDD